MSAAKDLRDLQVINLVMRGMKLAQIAKQVGLHRNTITKILRKPEIQELLDTMQKELVHRVTTDMIERHEVAREERARKRQIRQAERQGTSFPSVYTPFDTYAPIRQYVAKQR